MKDTFSVLLGVIVVLLAVGGYIANIMKLLVLDTMGGEMMVRILGVVMPPLGAFLGFF